ncbi:MAG TPA: ribosome-associated translation inhibitor RaiA [Candidatus Saccharimonadales bacterium]|nr:ribosome-associated translation inhibitor RaiA [Candidatus Saccharimonadales bacterium]
MIENIQMAGVHTKLTAEEEDYITRKIGPMDKFIPKKAREATKAEVKIKQQKSKDQAKFTCEVVMHLPHEPITVHERATTVLASIDLAEDKLKRQLRKYKERHGGPRIHRRLIVKFTRTKKR